MKNCFFILLLVFPFIAGNAQVIQKRSIQAVETEIAGGVGVGFNKMGFDQNQLAYSIKGEIRYNTPSGAFDFGLGAQLVRLDRLSYDTQHHDAFPSWQVYAAGDYNWRINDYLTLFCGLAAGVSRWTQTSAYSLSITPNKWSPYIAPRVGIEAWNRLRFTITASIMNKETSFIGLSLGYSFGGKPL